VKLILGILVAVASAAISSAASADPLRVAILETLSGPQASTGRLYDTAVRYVLDKVNAAGGFNGEKIVITEYDNGGTSSGASEKFKQAVADRVHVVFQGSSSAVAGQISEDVRKHNLRNKGKEIIYINVGAFASELTGPKCHFHSFRLTATAPMIVNALVKVMKEEGTLGTRIYSINQNYSWGQDMEAAIKEAAPMGGYEVVEAVLHDVNRIQDFAPFVAKIKLANPDTVMTGNWSNDLLLLMKEVGNAGLKVRFATAFLNQPGNIGNAGEIAMGNYVAHVSSIELGDGSVARDYQAVTGHMPAYIEPSTIDAAKLFATALSSLNFNGKDIVVNQIALALENTKVDTIEGPQSIRKEDHQPAEQVMYPVQSSCKMQRP
jgi:branched-chain amino acid transport system substrate-binding protein